MPKRVSILGLTVSGNRGAESMLLSIIAEMDALFGECKYDLISVYPTEDAQQKLPERLSLVSGKPLAMLLWILPVSLLLGPFAGFAAVRNILRRSEVLKSFLDADIVLDSGGVAFVDNRGLPLLIYNISLCLPPALLGTPVVKLAQALGPFQTVLNRVAARWVLPKMSGVAARGEITYQHLSELGLENAILATDTAFLMPSSESASSGAKEVLGSFLDSSRRSVGISPSVVVDDYCKKHGIDYGALLVEFCQSLLNRGYSVALIPHSVRAPGKGRMNNDGIICRQVYEQLGDSESVLCIDAELDAPTLRSLIAAMDFFVASRFHSMISSLASEVPTMLVGWSHKYQEVMDVFELGDYALGFDALGPGVLEGWFDRLVRDERVVREKLRTHLPKARSRAKRNFQLVAEILEQGDG